MVEAGAHVLRQGALRRELVCCSGRGRKGASAGRWGTSGGGQGAAMRCLATNLTLLYCKRLSSSWLAQNENR